MSPCGFLFFYYYCLISCLLQRMYFQNQLSCQRFLCNKRNQWTGSNEMFVHPLFKKIPLKLIFLIIRTECKEDKTNYIFPTEDRFQ